MAALAAQGACKSFGRHQVLAGLDLEIAAAEMVAVVGENGSGKSTLLRILAGDLRPDAGRVAIRGRPGYCPQAAVLDDALTVDQHVRYFQAAYRLGATSRAAELIGRLGYGRHRNQPLMPIGPARLAEPDPGLSVDVMVLAVGSAAIVTLLLARVAWPAWRQASAWQSAERDAAGAPGRRSRAAEWLARR